MTSTHNAQLPHASVLFQSFSDRTCPNVADLVVILHNFRYYMQTFARKKAKSRVQRDERKKDVSQG
jgi:hypothetical protein